MVLPRYRTLFTKATASSPYAVASKARASVGPCPQANTQPSRGAKQADTSTCVPRGAALSPLVEPLPQPWPHRMPAPTAQQGRDHRILAGTLGQHGAIDPQGQPATLGPPQVRQMGGQSFGASESLLVASTWITSGVDRW